MLRRINLQLLLKQLAFIEETPTFNPRLKTYIQQLQEAANVFLDRFESIPEAVQRYMVNGINHAIKFLSGSTSKSIPYEIAYALELALNEWTSDGGAKRAIITTGISPEIGRGFYFHNLPEQFYILVESFTRININDRLVQICLPEIYRHRPLYCTPLYHELGHYIASRYRIVTQWANVAPPNLTLPISGNLERHQITEIYLSHLEEIFADIFAAAYIGHCSHEHIEALAGYAHPATDSHPATSDRIRIVQDFLNGTSNPIIDSLFTTLEAYTVNGWANLPKLNKKFKSIDLISAFGNIRPFQIQDETDVHGIFPSAWSYLGRALKFKYGNWEHIDGEETEQVINNLVEKSIRNFMLVKKWNENS